MTITKGSVVCRRGSESCATSLIDLHFTTVTPYLLPLTYFNSSTRFIAAIFCASRPFFAILIMGCRKSHLGHLPTFLGPTGRRIFAKLASSY